MDSKEILVRGIMENFPEACVSLDCVRCNYKDLEFTFYDCDENKTHVLSKQKLIETVPLMFTNKWPIGCTKVPVDILTNPEVMDEWLCQSDGWDDEAFVQLAIYGQLIYG